MGVHQTSGEFREQEGQLFFVSGQVTYRVSFSGLKKEDTTVLPIFERLEKTEGVVLRSGEALRRYVQREEGGSHPLTEGDYWEVSVGGYWGFGGYIAIKVDRFGRVYAGSGVGIGVGQWGISITQGHLVQDYDPDYGQLDRNLGESQVALQVGYYLGGGLSVVDREPTPVQYGFVLPPGASMSFGYAWRVR